MEQELLKACEKGDLDRVRQLLSQGCSPMVANDGNGTPLHLACRSGSVDIVQYLITEQNCNPQCTDRRGQTPLHEACQAGELEVVKYLIDIHCNKECTDNDGRTPLHFAAWNGCSDVVTFLLREVHCNPNCTTSDGDTPLNLATEPMIFRELVRYGANPSDYARLSKYLPSSCPTEPAASRVKVFFVGDHHAGKSTLTEAIKIQAKSTGLARIINRVTKVTGIEPKTAGVIPHEVRSTNFGHVTLYDFAGHKEFYASHDSLVRNVVTGSSAAVFLLVTDLRMSDKEFRESIIFWLNFIDNRCSSLHNKPHIIIIGSHADEVKSKEEKSRKSNIVASLQSAMEFPGLHFNGYVAMNCCYAESSAMTGLCHSLANSCEDLRSKVVSTFRSHCFSVYLLDKFRDSPAVALNTVYHTIREESESKDVQLLDFVPHTLPDICSICEELNERGLILLVKNEASIENSWIILDQAVLLSRVTGTVFAPEGFREHRNLATSTGVVPFSKIRGAFPDLDTDMIARFLCHLEFCHEITDPEILQLLQGDHSHFATSVPTFDEKYFFFPALVSVGIESIVQMWEPKSLFAYHCGWLLQCSNPTQFLTPRFLHVLLLRLAFAFSFALDSQESRLDHPALQRKCRIWKNGLFWANRSGVEALVEVVDKTVTVLLRCLKGQEIDCVLLRSAIIQKVLSAKREFCPIVSTSESFILPEDATRYPLKPQSELSLVSCAEIAKAIASGERATLDTEGKLRTIEELLHFEPYYNLGVIMLQELFNENSPRVTQVVSHDFLNRLAKSAHSNNVAEILTRILSPHDPPLSDSSREMLRILQQWRSQKVGTYQTLRRELDNFSVFAGRNPLEMAGVHHQVLSKRYMALVFYERKDTPNIWMVHFAIVKNLQKYRNAVVRIYSARNAEPGPELDIEFDQDCVLLDIPFEGTILESGWNITPINYPMITKEEVDRFTPCHVMPCCQLQIKWTGSGDMPEFTHVVKLQGAKPPNSFTLQYYPDVNDDLFDVMSELTPVAARWRHLGTGLRLKSGDLDTIALKHHGNPQDYLTDVHTRTHTDAIEYDEGMDKEEQLTGVMERHAGLYDVPDIAAFLHDLGMDEYMAVFEEEEVTGMDLLRMPDRALKELNVNSPLHRLKIKILFKRRLLNANPKYPVQCVVRFLQSVGKFCNYAKSFEENVIDGEILLAATPEVLEELGVTKGLHQTQIITWFVHYIDSL